MVCQQEKSGTVKTTVEGESMNYKFKSNTDFFLYEDRRVLAKYADGVITAQEAIASFEERHGNGFESVEQFKKWAKGIGYDPTETI